MRIEQTTTVNFSELMPLMRSYQEFYKALRIDDAHNNRHFSRFISANDKSGPEGAQYLLYDDATGNNAIGFSTHYYQYSSVNADRYLLLNDLFVRDDQRGKGYGRALIEHAKQVAGEQGLARLIWFTMQGNTAAQKLYDGTGANKSAWFEYEIRI